eukprot:3386239-Pleurochrysis_carterae.AAC.1
MPTQSLANRLCAMITPDGQLPSAPKSQTILTTAAGSSLTAAPFRLEERLSALSGSTSVSATARSRPCSVFKAVRKYLAWTTSK